MSIMDMNSQSSIETFLRKVFNSDPNFGSLTKAELRNRYIQQKGLAEFSIDEKKLFSSVVNEVIHEFTENTPKNKVSCNSTANGNTKTSRSSKNKKRIRSDDESGIDISETEYNKENLDSTNTEDQLNDDASKNNDSNISHSHVTSESEAELDQNKQTDDKLPKDTQQDKISSSDTDSSDDDFVPKTNLEKKLQKKTQQLNSSFSDVNANKNSSDTDVPSSNSIQDENISAKRKKSVQRDIRKSHKRQLPVEDSSSDGDSFIPVKKNILKKMNQEFKTSKKAKLEVASSSVKQNGHDLSPESEDKQELQEENIKGGKKKSQSDEAPKKSKKSPSTNSRIEHLKKYLRAAGLRIPSYNKLFESCRSQKAKVEKLLEVLHNAGMKGRPTLEKCKKLKKKIETKKDIESLDLSNIIKTEGRPKRNSRSLYLNSSPAANICNTSPIDNFSSLKDIIDSDESDTPVKVFSRVKNIVSDDDDF